MKFNTKQSKTKVNETMKNKTMKKTKSYYINRAAAALAQMRATATPKERANLNYLGAMLAFSGSDFRQSQLRFIAEWAEGDHFTFFENGQWVMLDSVPALMDYLFKKNTAKAISKKEKDFIK